MKTLYLDIFSGISGDMFIGALLDLGVPFDDLDRELARLDIPDEYYLEFKRGHKASIEGVKFDVQLPDGKQGGGHHHPEDHHHDHHHHHGPAEGKPGGRHQHSHEHGDHGHEHQHGRTFREIREMIKKSSLSPWVKTKSIAVFERIARAEGKIHGKPPERVHFHEVGAVDSIIDIVGAAIGLELLGKPRVVASPVTEGQGFVKCAHGRFPIPAPATLAILAERGVVISQCDEPHELVTPTGAAILAEYVEEFGPMRSLIPEKVGYGLGQRENRGRPNVVRAVLGRSTDDGAGENDWETDQITVLETNLDDMNPEWLGHLVERAFAHGALDVFHTPIQMKKNRPGVLLTLLCNEADQEHFTKMLLLETSALGVRRTTASRRKLRRETRKVATPYGDVEVKIGRLNGDIVQAAPEYEVCKRIADAKNIPLKWVYEAANAAIEKLKI